MVVFLCLLRQWAAIWKAYLVFHKQKNFAIHKRFGVFCCGKAVQQFARASVSKVMLPWKSKIVRCQLLQSPHTQWAAYGQAYLVFYRERILWFAKVIFLQNTCSTIDQFVVSTWFGWPQISTDFLNIDKSHFVPFGIVTAKVMEVILYLPS